MPAGERDLPQAVLHLVRFIDIFGGDGCHAHNGIHGGADVVAHIGQEFALGPVGVLRLLLCLVQLRHLLPGEAEIDQKDRQHCQHDNTAPGQGGPHALIAQGSQRLVQNAAGHDRDHGPLRIGQGHAIDVARLAADGHHHAELCAGLYGLPQLRHRVVDVLQAVVPAVFPDPVVAVIGCDVRILYHKGTVGPDDMGEDQGAVHPQGKGVVDLVDGKAHHQGGTPLSAGHGVAHIVGIAHGDTIEQHRLSAGRGPQGHQLVAVVHVGQENLLVLHRHILARHKAVLL